MPLGDIFIEDDTLHSKVAVSPFGIYLPWFPCFVLNKRISFGYSGKMI